MSGISYKVTVDDADMSAKLAELIDRMANAEGFYKNVGEHLMNSVGKNFDNEQGPDGEGWAALSPVTIARREKAGGSASPILRVSGALRGSINSEPSATEVRIGTALIYAAIQHFGGESKGFMQPAEIPARPYLGISAEDEEEILAIAEEWLAVE